MIKPMFQSKSKIFAISVLAVSLMFLASLVSFKIYLATKRNPTYDGSWVGYIVGGSYDESSRLSQQLLKDKVVEHALVLPSYLKKRTFSPGMISTTLSLGHLLLVQTSPDKISAVKAAVKSAAKVSMRPKEWSIEFYAGATETPFLSFGLPEESSERVGRPTSAGGSGTGLSTTTLRLEEEGTRDIRATVEKPFLVQVIGTGKPKHFWTPGPETSPSLKFDSLDEDEEDTMMDEAVFYFKVTPTAVGRQLIQLNYADPDGSEPPLVKTINVIVAGNRKNLKKN